MFNAFPSHAVNKLGELLAYVFEQNKIAFNIGSKTLGTFKVTGNFLPPNLIP